MLAYGATFDLTPKEKGMKGAIARAKELAAAIPNAWIPQQFENLGQHRDPRTNHRARNHGRFPQWH